MSDLKNKYRVIAAMTIGYQYLQYYRYRLVYTLSTFLELVGEALADVLRWTIRAGPWHWPWPWTCAREACGRRMSSASAWTCQPAVTVGPRRPRARCSRTRWSCGCCLRTRRIANGGRLFPRRIWKIEGLVIWILILLYNIHLIKLARREIWLTPSPKRKL